MKTSLIISTYNRPDALEVCLKSIRNLTLKPDEVIIGDDGSSDVTRSLVMRIQNDFPVKLKYIWQPDEGFRLAKIRNRCVAESEGDYIIQIDGDIFIHRDFISDHLRQARKGCYLKGGRVELDKSKSEEICKLSEPCKISLFSSGILAKRPNTLRLPLLADWLAPRYRQHRDNVLGCNMSFFKSDFMAVNGYDESFEGWGGEDLDLSFRFKNLGLGRRYLKFCGIAYHLWHKEASKEQSERNHELARSRRDSGKIIATLGLSQYIENNIQATFHR